MHRPTAATEAALSACTAQAEAAFRGQPERRAIAALQVPVEVAAGAQVGALVATAERTCREFPSEARAAWAQGVRGAAP